MTTREFNPVSAASLRHDLEMLERERAAAALSALADNGAYMADLLDEIDAVRNAYVGAAVTEIASLRAALTGPLAG